MLIGTNRKFSFIKLVFWWKFSILDSRSRGFTVWLNPFMSNFRSLTVLKTFLGNFVCTNVFCLIFLKFTKYTYHISGTRTEIKSDQTIDQE